MPAQTYDYDHPKAYPFQPHSLPDCLPYVAISPTLIPYNAYPR